MKKAASAAAVLAILSVVALMSAYGSQVAQSQAACAGAAVTTGLPGSEYHGKLDQVFPAHYLDQPGGRAQLSQRQVRLIAQSVGLPGEVFALIAKGESHFYPGVVQRDPGNGMVGIGLWQITPNSWAKVSEVYGVFQRLGGSPGMRNPIQNAKMAKWLYEHATSKVPGTPGFPWYGIGYLKGYKGDLTPQTETGTGAVAGADTNVACQPVAVGDAGELAGTPQAVIDRVVLPIAAQCGVHRTPAENDAANARHGPTVSGGLSDHQGPPQKRWAADMSNGQSPTPEMDCLETALAQRFHLTPLDLNTTGAAGSTQQSSGTLKGYRFQLIYRSYLGGNHDNHVHFGVALIAGPVAA